MNNQEIITKYNLRIGWKSPKEKGICTSQKPTDNDIIYIKEHKQEIIDLIEKSIRVKRETEEREKQAEIDAIKKGEKEIEVYYHDGEYLSGYMVHSEAAELLRKIGLVKDVDGWGYLVDNNLVKALGKKFSYLQAFNFIQPKLEKEEKEKADRIKKAEQKRQQIFLIAKETEQKQILRTYHDDCHDPHEECNMDIITVYAMPDGTEKIIRSHTW